MTLQMSRVGKMIHALQRKGRPEYNALANIAIDARKFQFDVDEIIGACYLFTRPTRLEWRSLLPKLHPDPPGCKSDREPLAGLP